MIFPVNKPILLSKVAVTLATLTVSAVPRPGLSYGPGVPQQLTLNDSATFAGAGSGNIVWTAPVTALGGVVDRTITMSVTMINGLVVSAVPPGVAIKLDYQ